MGGLSGRTHEQIQSSVIKREAVLQLSITSLCSVKGRQHTRMQHSFPSPLDVTHSLVILFFRAVYSFLFLFSTFSAAVFITRVCLTAAFTSCQYWESSLVSQESHLCTGQGQHGAPPL